MADYLTYPVHHRAHLDWDPCPGSPEGTRAIAAALVEAANTAGELAALIDGLRLDTGGWDGASAQAYDAGVVQLPRHLEDTAAALREGADVLGSWAGALEDLQQRADAVDADLGHAREVLATARGVTLPSGYDTTLVREAHQEVARVEADAEQLHEDYLAAARVHGMGLNAAGEGVWGASLSQRALAAVDDVGDLLEGSAAGRFARRHSDVLGPVAHAAEASGEALDTAAVATGAVGVFFPPAAAVAAALGAAGRMAGGVGTAAQLGLALGGHGRWTDVLAAAMPSRPLPGGHGGPSAGRPGGAVSPRRRHRRTGERDGAAPEHEGAFDARDVARQEVSWAELVERPGWALDDAAVAQRWPDAQPWGLPDGIAYLPVAEP